MNKDELLTEVINQEYAKIKMALDKIKTQSLDSIDELIYINEFIVTFLKGINPTSINDLKKTYPQAYTTAQSQFRDLFSQTIVAGIREGKTAKLFRDDINEDLIARLHTERIDQLQETSGFWGTKASTPEVIKDMITYYLRGLVTKQGDALLDKYLTDYNKYSIAFDN